MRGFLSAAPEAKSGLACTSCVITSYSIHYTKLYESEISFLPLPEDDPRQRCPDISLAKSALGWEPKVALEEGLKKTIPYFERIVGSWKQS